MDKKRRNRFLIALACMALVIGVFALITVVVTSTTMAEAQTQANGETLRFFSEKGCKKTD